MVPGRRSNPDLHTTPADQPMRDWQASLATQLDPFISSSSGESLPAALANPAAASASGGVPSHQLASIGSGGALRRAGGAPSRLGGPGKTRSAGSGTAARMQAASGGRIHFP